jgi:hypothetical protein
MRLGLVGPVAVVAMLVVGAEGASGAPELLYCMANGSGKYETRAKCEEGNETGTTLGWERETGPLAGETVMIHFTSGKGHLATPKHNIECTSDEGTAEVTGVKTLSKMVVTYKTCKDTTILQECNSTEPLGASGEILTKELGAELVDLKSGGNLPGGMLALPAAGTTFTTISCAGGLIEKTVTGEVVGEFTPASINKMTLSSELLFEENAGKQLWTKVEEGAAAHELTAFGESAFEVGKETAKLLVNGEEVSGELMFP